MGRMAEYGPPSTVEAGIAPSATPQAIGALPADRSEATRQSYRTCARIVRERAKNFYLGLRLTPEPKRSALFAIYAWMRAADGWAKKGSDDDIRGKVACHVQWCGLSRAHAERVVAFKGLERLLTLANRLSCQRCVWCTGCGFESLGDDPGRLLMARLTN